MLPVGGKVEHVRATLMGLQVQSPAGQRPWSDSLEHAMYLQLNQVSGLNFFITESGFETCFGLGPLGPLGPGTKGAAIL